MRISEQADEREHLAALDVVRVRAENPGPLTLSGTNTWVAGRDPAYVIDPGPALEDHIQRLVELTSERGGLGGIALTHHHPDHRDGLPLLLARAPAPVAAAGSGVDVPLAEGTRFGPLQALGLPGHTRDHFALMFGATCFVGDAVLGEGSVFLTPEPGALSGYLDGLRRLLERAPRVLCPGHGPAIWDPTSKIGEYIEHRLERERRVLTALANGIRSVSELLDHGWSDVPEQLRGLATFTLAAHLDKLEEEGALPAHVERPDVSFAISH